MKNKRILITGAVGSIGSEIVRQVCLQEPESIVFFDRNEEKVFYLEKEINEKFPYIKIIPRIGSITDKKRADMIFEETKPHIVFHTAAMKHVPLCEENPHECIINNVLGTKNIVESSINNKVENFLFISTDKAVEPVSIMGMSKRLCEIFIQSIWNRYNTKFTIVRFGNVYGSSGSVVEIFQKQLYTGKITITHPHMERYFINVEDAVSRLLDIANREIAGVITFNMGDPVKILDLAEDLIKKYGVDCEIVYTGMRPGEKVKESLIYLHENLYKLDEKIYQVVSIETRYNGDDYRNICLLINDCNYLNKQELLTEIERIL